MNSLIIKQFELLIDQIKHDIDNTPNNPKDQFRLQRIKTATDIIKKYPKAITSGKDLKDIKGIGSGTIERIDEILKTGMLSEIKIQQKHRNILKHIDELKTVIGIGDKIAHKLVTEYNIKTVQQLKDACKTNKLQLCKQIKTGLKYHGIYQQHIPRHEITEMATYIKHIAKSIDEHMIVDICGSYRRMKPYSNDIDILITHKSIAKKAMIKPHNYLHDMISELKKQRFIQDDLTNKNFTVKYMGLCKYDNNPVRRIDIRLVPYNSYYTALLYFTGSGEFNKRMRFVAIELGYELSEYGLFKYVDGKKYRFRIHSEKDVFDKLGMEYVEPKERE